MGFYQPEWCNDPANICFKEKFRWKFQITDVSSDGVNALPGFRGARPGVSFKEMNGEHLNETIYFPSKPEWKQINLTLYDIVKPNENPVFSWIKRAYNPKNCSAWYPCLDDPSLKAIATLTLYDGCGNTQEEWTLEHVWPQNADFGDLDMATSEIVTVEVTLRYDRAYITYPTTETPIAFPTESTQSCPSITCSIVNFEAVATPDFRAVW